MGLVAPALQAVLALSALLLPDRLGHWQVAGVLVLGLGILTMARGVRAGGESLRLLPFALGSFLGPVLLGRFFDTVGRRPMIAFTYGISAVLLAVAGYLFKIELLGPAGQTAAWMVVFFFASAAASSAYLTVAETFPLEIRALAIAAFYALGTGIGGVSGPLLFGVVGVASASNPLQTSSAARGRRPASRRRRAGPSPSSPAPGGPRVRRRTRATTTAGTAAPPAPGTAEPRRRRGYT